MTPEQRFDRLERIVKLMIKAGLRARRQVREQGEKIDMIINMQIQTESRFAKNEERFAKNEERFAKNEESLGRLIESQAETARLLRALINRPNEGQPGRSSEA